MGTAVSWRAPQYLIPSIHLSPDPPADPLGHPWQGGTPIPPPPAQGSRNLSEGRSRTAPPLCWMSKSRCCQKLRKGAMPVPGPMRMQGTWGSWGRWNPGALHAPEIQLSTSRVFPQLCPQPAETPPGERGGENEVESQDVTFSCRISPKGEQFAHKPSPVLSHSDNSGGQRAHPARGLTASSSALALCGPLTLVQSRAPLHPSGSD